MRLVYGCRVVENMSPTKLHCELSGAVCVGSKHGSGTCQRVCAHCDALVSQLLHAQGMVVSALRTAQDRAIRPLG